MSPAPSRPAPSLAWLERLARLERTLTAGPPVLQAPLAHMRAIASSMTENDAGADGLLEAAAAEIERALERPDVPEHIQEVLTRLLEHSNDLSGIT